MREHVFRQPVSKTVPILNSGGFVSLFQSILVRTQPLHIVAMSSTETVSEMQTKWGVETDLSGLWGCQSEIE
jgi:hypothetical protein